MTCDVPAFLKDPALVAVLDALPDARVVGGAVRDTLAGRPVADIDLATASVPTDVVAALARVGIRSVPTGLDHGTVTAISGGRGFEITTLRRDVATDGRRATVAFSTDWREDAERRDFTINAMSMDRDGTVYDYFGGLADLHAGVLRFVGDPAVRIAEDYLRILRFFRFFARYGTGAPDPAAVAAIRAGVPGLAALSVERVWHELQGLLAVPSCGAAVALMAETGVQAAVLPEGASVAGLERLLTASAPADPVLRLAALLTGDALAVAVRLKLSVADRDRLVALRLPCPVAPGDDDTALRRALAAEDPAVLVGRAWLTGAGEPGWATLRARLLAMPRPVFPLEGRHVLGLGVPPGPAVGALLRDVRAWWLERGCADDAAACLAMVRERVGAGV
jgi:poly(A) polymerase/tRNA nucleotidyltransferase (CCA-adding enzyme)